MDQAQLKRQREEAREAMMSEEHRQRRLVEQETIAKKRQVAAQAMESPKHRQLRVARQRADHQRKLSDEQRREEARKSAEAKQKQLERETQARQQAETQAKKATEQRKQNILESENLIEAIKTRELNITPLRTLKLDMARAVKEEGLSISKIAMTQEARRRLGKTITPTKKNGGGLKWLGLLGLLMVVAGGVYWYQFYYVTSTSPNAVPPSRQEPLIFSDQHASLDITSIHDADELRHRITQEVVAGNLNPNEIRDITPELNGAPLEWNAFATRLDIKPPAPFERSLAGPFMLGVHNSSGQRKLFLLFKLRSYDQAFASTYDWERTMFDDLGSLFHGSRLIAVRPKLPFIDRLVLNKDTRHVTDTENKMLLFYSFLDTKTLLIAQDQESFLTIYNRFTTPLN